MPSMLMVSCRKAYWSSTEFSSGDQVRSVDLESGVGTVVPRVSKASSAADVARILQEEFERWFGKGSAPADIYEAPASRIWDAVLEFRRTV